VRLVIICEDSQHEAFIRRFLEGKGWDKRELFVVKSTRGRGAAERWVRNRFLLEYKTYFKGHVRSALLTMVDADGLSHEQRLQQFKDAVGELPLPWRSPENPVAFWIPVRNVETWIQHLDGNQVDETRQYPKLARASSCAPAVRTFVNHCDNAMMPEQTPESLKRACMEYHSRLHTPRG
jgi:hypothetical protein